MMLHSTEVNSYFGAIFVHARIIVLQHFEDSMTSGEAEKY